MSRSIRVIGMGVGDPRQLTVEAIDALRSVDYLVVDAMDADAPLGVLLETSLAHHVGTVPPVVEVGGLETLDARAEAYEKVLLDRDGDVGFLVWGEPAFHDPTIRAVEAMLARGAVAAEWDVLPGISSVQVLAARHRIALQDVGTPLLVTTGALLHEARDAGAENILVVLSSTVDLEGFDDWDIWWAANLGTADERLVSGRVVEVAIDVLAARIDVRTRAGWVVDVYLLRKRPAFTAPS